jgi:hypothetical protein
MMKATIDAAAKGRSAKSRMSSIGLSERISQQTNARAARIATAN